jgi:hypothetical protein
MQRLSFVTFFAALLASSTLIGVGVQSAELEGSLQYPPLSVGEDAQPPPPARMLPQRVAPGRIEGGVSGSSLPPSTQRFSIRPALRLYNPGVLPQSGNGG